MGQATKPVTIGDIRRAIEELPNTCIVICKDDKGIDRELDFCSGAHDGRYGPILMLKMGGFAEKWNPPPEGVPTDETMTQLVDELFERPPEHD